MMMPTGASAQNLPRDLPEEFRAFLAAFPAGEDVRPYDGELPPQLSEHAHPSLIAFWRKVGFGSFGNGFLVFFNPHDYESVLARWLQRDQPDPSLIPFARTAFGDIIYFRDLREKAKQHGLPADWKNASDVVFLSIHYHRTEMITWSMDEFFATALQQFLKDNEGSFYKLSSSLNTKQLGKGECYFFVPALALGGKVSKDSVKSGNCLVHQDILLQLHQ